MNRAAIGLCGALAALLLASCGDAPEPAAPSPTPPATDPVAAAAELEAHARSIAASSNGSLQFRHVDTSMATFKVDPRDTFTMSTYRVVFDSSQPEFAFVDSQQEGDAGYQTNSSRRDAWSGRFCTPSLRAIQQRLDIDFVYGQVLAAGKPDEKSADRMSAQCSKEP